MQVEAIRIACLNLNPDLFRRGNLDYCLGWVERLSVLFEKNGGFQLCGERVEKMSSILAHSPQKGPGYQLCQGVHLMLWDSHTYTFNSSLAVSCSIGTAVDDLKKAFVSKVPGTNHSPYKSTDIFSIWVLGKLAPLPESVFEFGVRSAAGIWTVEALAPAPPTAKCKPGDVPVPKELFLNI